LNNIQSAIEVLQAGSSVLIVDSEDREGETDIIYPASGVKATSIKYIKDVSNNSVNTVIKNEFAQKIGLPTQVQVLEKIYPNLDYFLRSRIASAPNFAFLIDYFSVKSGCTYADFALILNSLVEFELYVKAEKSSEVESVPEIFCQRFTVSGHLPILMSSEELLDLRKGHTELGIALARFASIIPVLVISELIDLETGKTVDKEKSLKIAHEKGIPCLYGKDILLMWEREKNK
jgi:3,4-dihydroxy 2-butanone 4-phosphate synthase